MFFFYFFGKKLNECEFKQNKKEMGVLKKKDVNVYF